MSRVTDVVCLFDYGSDVPDWFWDSARLDGSPGEWNRFKDIAAYPDDTEPGGHTPADHWGGGKVPQCAVLAAAINYLSHHEWLERIAAGDWTGKRHPVITIHTEDDEDFAVYLWNGSSFAQIQAPTVPQIALIDFGTQELGPGIFWHASGIQRAD